MVPRVEPGAEARPGLLSVDDAGADAGAVAGTYAQTDAAADAIADTSTFYRTYHGTDTSTQSSTYPKPDAGARPGEGRTNVLRRRGRRARGHGRRRCRTVDTRWFIRVI